MIQAHYTYSAVEISEKVLVTQSGPTLCDPMDPPGSSVHSILQARILEWVAISFSRGSSWRRDWTPVSHISGRFFTVWTTRKVHNKCNAPELSWNYSTPYPQCVEKLSSTKPVPGAKKIGYRCSKGWCDWILFGKFSLQLLVGRCILLRAARRETRVVQSTLLQPEPHPWSPGLTCSSALFPDHFLVLCLLF